MELIGGFFVILFLAVVGLGTVAVIIGVPFTLLFTKTGKKIREDGRKQEEVRRKYEAEVAATAETKLVDGKWRTVTTRTFRVIRNKKTGRKAAIIHLSRLGGHYYVQPLLKDFSIGASKPHWTRIENWQVIDEVDLPYDEGPASEPVDLDAID